MYILDSDLIRKTFISLAIAGILLSLSGYSCSSDKSDNAALNSNVCERRLKDEEMRFEKAIEQTKKHNEEGLITILEIASGSKHEQCTFAELSETASSVLTEKLLFDTDFWVKSLAETDYGKMEEFIKHGGLASINDDEYIESRKVLLTKLKKHKGDEKEIRLIKLLIAELGRNG